MKPFQILGHSSLDPTTLHFPSLSSPDTRGPTCNASIAGPAYAYSGGVQGWHQDDAGMSPTLVLWSDVYPTEVLLPDGEIVRGSDGDVVLVANKVAKHRVPADYIRAVAEGTAKPRRFARWINFNREPTEAEIAKWREILTRRAA